MIWVRIGYQCWFCFRFRIRFRFGFRFGFRTQIWYWSEFGLKTGVGCWSGCGSRSRFWSWSLILYVLFGDEVSLEILFVLALFYAERFTDLSSQACLFFAHDFQTKPCIFQIFQWLWSKLVSEHEGWCYPVFKCFRVFWRSLVNTLSRISHVLGYNYSILAGEAVSLI